MSFAPITSLPITPPNTGNLETQDTSPGGAPSMPLPPPPIKFLGDGRDFSISLPASFVSTLQVSNSEPILTNFLLPLLSQNNYLSLIAAEAFCVQTLSFIPPETPSEEKKNILTLLLSIYKQPSLFSPFTIDLHLTFLHILETHFQEYVHNFSFFIDQIKNYPRQNNGIWQLLEPSCPLFAPPPFVNKPGYVFLPFPFDISLSFNPSQPISCKTMIEHMCEELDRQCNTQNFWKNCLFLFGVRSSKNGIWETQLHKEFPDFSYMISLRSAYAPLLLLCLQEKMQHLPSNPKLQEIFQNLTHLVSEVRKNEPGLRLSTPNIPENPLGKV